MPWPFLLWLLAFIAQAAALGCIMYQLVQLTDLEVDQINPHDASKNYNRVVLPYILAQCVLTGIVLLGGNWLIGALQAAVLAHEVFLLLQGKQFIDVTEIFRVLKQRKSLLTKKMIVCLVLFAWTLYRFVEILVLSLVHKSGRKAAANILREAAASLH